MKYSHLLLITISICISTISCKNSKPGSEPDLKNEVDSISYFTGIFTAYSLKNFDDTVFNSEIFYRALKEVFKQKEFKMNELETDYNIGIYFDKLQKKQNDKNLTLGKEFLTKNKLKKGIVTTHSGLQYEVIKEGSGPTPKLDNKVIVNYSISLINGQEAANTKSLGHPDTLLLNKADILTGLIEGLQLMNTGSHYRIYLPTELAFGLKAPPLNGLKPNMVVIYDMSLIAILH
jgi:FKBP-type peptidyl-prolyl cis-trans isomerase FklB